MKENFAIAGFHYLSLESRNLIEKELKEGDIVKLFPILNNQYDSEAISVLFRGTHIGWYPAKNSQKSNLFKLLCQGKEITGKIYGIHLLENRGNTNWFPELTFIRIELEFEGFFN